MGKSTFRSLDRKADESIGARCSRRARSNWCRGSNTEIFKDVTESRGCQLRDQFAYHSFSTSTKANYERRGVQDASQQAIQCFVVAVDGDKTRFSGGRTGERHVFQLPRPENKVLTLYRPPAVDGEAPAAISGI